MDYRKHETLGDQTGNSNQATGRHREGVGLIPLGDSDPNIPIGYKDRSNYAVDMMELRDADPNIRRI